MKKTILIMTSGLGSLVSIYDLVTLLTRYPQAERLSLMPETVDESMHTFLESMESELMIHRSDVVPFLQPGISDQPFQQAEASLGRSIYPEMKALYQWHNGLANDMELFPGHGF